MSPGSPLAHPSAAACFPGDPPLRSTARRAPAPRSRPPPPGSQMRRKRTWSSARPPSSSPASHLHHTRTSQCMIRQNFSQRWALAVVILSWAPMPRQINAASGYVQHNLASDWAQFPARRLRPHIAGKVARRPSRSCRHPEPDRRGSPGAKPGPLRIRQPASAVFSFLVPRKQSKWAVTRTSFV